MMIYNVYAVDGENTNVTASEAEAAEIGCDTCGATWLLSVSGIFNGCPYCGRFCLAIDKDDFKETPMREQGADESGRSKLYGRDLRGVARALWNGSMDRQQAYEMFIDTIRISLRAAWYEGALSCGIQPSELTPEEQQGMLTAIYTEQGHVFGLIDFIEQNSKANGGKFAAVSSRVDMWALRYTDVVNRARLLACADAKLKWVWSPEKEHCHDCARLNGKIKRGSQWDAYGIRPQSPALACGGWRCGCALVPTDEPMSKGPLPRIG
jgi:hypothetical protein